MPFNNKDTFLLEKTYLSMSKSLQDVPSDETFKDKEDEEELEFSASADLEGELSDVSPLSDVENSEEDRTIDIQTPVSVSDLASSSATPTIAGTLDLPDETHDEEHEMIIDNLNSIRESVTKIANFCMTGCTLETWQSQKLAIAMDNLAEVARRLR